MTDGELPPPIENGVYLHSKSGKTYTVIGVALHTETGKYLVVYTPNYGPKDDFFARPYEMFVENVTVRGVEVPRFQKIDMPKTELV